MPNFLTEKRELNASLSKRIFGKEEITQDIIAMIQKTIQDELDFPANKITINVP